MLYLIFALCSLISLQAIHAMEEEGSSPEKKRSPLSVAAEFGEMDKVTIDLIFHQLESAQDSTKPFDPKKAPDIKELSKLSPTVKEALEFLTKGTTRAHDRSRTMLLDCGIDIDVIGTPGGTITEIAAWRSRKSALLLRRTVTTPDSDLKKEEAVKTARRSSITNITLLDGIDGLNPATQATVLALLSLAEERALKERDGQHYDKKESGPLDAEKQEK